MNTLKFLKYPIVIGISISILIVLISLLKQDLLLCKKLSGWVGAGFLIIAAILSGAFLNGDRIRANFDRENKEDRLARIKYSSFFFQLCLPNIILFFISYILNSNKL
ncbi:DUF5316 domain-containing protein [Paenibacillus alba]|uniref:DUF5316 domain-containing protein n=1 Tax=Paenibacillus alba TaxID=1197127 RepID=UPI0015664A7D|nr:DUF5316 domain-containing protein [Paenibacillus alba]NQX67997.1 DUF5316 domain-containing protein [Paenibacillus alba]